jgi:hypothetical protein
MLLLFQVVNHSRFAICQAKFDRPDPLRRDFAAFPHGDEGAAYQTRSTRRAFNLIGCRMQRLFLENCSEKT